MNFNRAKTTGYIWGSPKEMGNVPLIIRCLTPALLCAVLTRSEAMLVEILDISTYPEAQRGWGSHKSRIVFTGASVLPPYSKFSITEDFEFYR